MRREHEGRTYLARLVVGLGRIRKDRRLPSMRELLGPPEAEREERQSPDDMLFAFQAMQAAGAPINIKKVT